MIEHGMPAVAGQPKHYAAQVFPVAADADSGWWQLNLDAPMGWLTPPIHPGPPGVRSDTHRAAQRELIIHSIDLRRVPILHALSWREERWGTVYHFFAIVDCGDQPVLLDFPDATPIPPELGEQVGQPRTHGAADPPAEVRYADIVRHGLRTLWGHCDPEFLSFDATIAAALPPVCLPHLRDLKPAFAKMFGQIHQAA